MSTLLDLVHVISRRMVIFLNISLVVIPLFYLITWGLLGTHFFSVISNLLVSVGYQPLEFFTLGGMVNPADITWTLASKSMMFLSKTIQLTPILIGLFLLKLIFENYKKEAIFIVQNARYYRWIGWLLWVDGMAVKPLGNLLSNAVVGSSFHDGEILIKAGFSITELFIAGLVLVISQVMLEGSRLREENQLTV